MGEGQIQPRLLSLASADPSDAVINIGCAILKGQLWGLAGAGLEACLEKLRVQEEVFGVETSRANQMSWGHGGLWNSSATVLSPDLAS